MTRGFLWEALSSENLGGWFPVCKQNCVRCHFLCTTCKKQLRPAWLKEQKANSTFSKPSHSMLPHFLFWLLLKFLLSMVLVHHYPIQSVNKYLLSTNNSEPNKSISFGNLNSRGTELYRWMQWCADKCLTSSSPEKRLLFVASDDFCGINTPVVADFKLPSLAAELGEMFSSTLLYVSAIQMWEV